MSFDHTDPEIQDMMVERSMEQARDMRGSALYGYYGQSVEGMRRAMKEADPIAAILDEDEERDVEEVYLDSFSLGGSGIAAYVKVNNGAWQKIGVSIGRTMASATAEFEKVQKDFQDALAQQLSVTDEMADQLFQYVKGVFDRAKPVIEKLSVLTDDDQEILRHGFAVTCPKHGPTRGGTCRKCQRGRHRARW